MDAGVGDLVSYELCPLILPSKTCSPRTLTMIFIPFPYIELITRPERTL